MEKVSYKKTMKEEAAKKVFYYKGGLYPEYLKQGNADTFIMPYAEYFCKGNGLDIGGISGSVLPGARMINILNSDGFDAYNLPEEKYDYIFSSHTLEHLDNYVDALKYWRDHLKEDGVLFLYLPHPDMEYWLPQNNKNHLHLFHPKSIYKLLKDLGFSYILQSERDLYWSFAVVGILESGIAKSREKQLLKCIPDVLKYDSILYVGASCSRQDTLNLFIEKEYDYKILEIYEPNVIYLKKYYENVIQGDVRNIDNLGLGEFDVVMWWHGPEHIKKKELIPVFNKLKIMTKKVLIVACPYGKYEQDFAYGNPHEIHLSSLYPKFFETRGWKTDITGKKNVEGSNLLAWWRQFRP